MSASPSGRRAAFIVVLVAAAGCGDERKSPRIVIQHDPNLPAAARPEPSIGESHLPEPGPAPTAGSRSARHDFLPVHGDGYRGYVRPATSPDHWEPDADDIAAVERAVPAAAAAAAARGDIPSGGRELTEYARTYIGYRNDGREFIEIRLYCPDSAHLADKDVIVTGGGGCLLFAAYDTQEGEFVYFRTRRGRSTRGQSTFLPPSQR